MSLFERLAQIRKQREGPKAIDMHAPPVKTVSPPATESDCECVLAASAVGGREVSTASGSFCCADGNRSYVGRCLVLPPLSIII